MSEETPNPQQRKRPVEELTQKNDSMLGEPVPPPKLPRTEKAYKGLRHFSMMVCRKVEAKGTTSYNEVADELVQEVIAERRKENPNYKCDEKNIRRRVYDALNVLMAMDIIAKDKKDITWKGLPTQATQDLGMLQREVDYRREEIKKKREAMTELLIQQVCFRNLSAHNQRREYEQQQANDTTTEEKDNKIPLPFLVVNTNPSAVIQCNMSRDRTDVKFEFSSLYEVNDANMILKRLGMTKTTEEALRIWMPEDIYKYCEEHELLGKITGQVETPTTEKIATSDYPKTYNTRSRAAATEKN